MALKQISGRRFMGSLSLNSRFDGHPRQNLLHPFIGRYNPQTLRILPVFLFFRV